MKAIKTRHKPLWCGVFSERGTYFDIWLSPIDSNGRRVKTSHILRGRATLSKHAAAGYWRPDQISLRDPQGNERHEGQNDFGWGLYLDNPLADDTAPSICAGVDEAVFVRRIRQRAGPYQILTATWDVIEENGVTSNFGLCQRRKLSYILQAHRRVRDV